MNHTNKLSQIEKSDILTIGGYITSRLKSNAISNLEKIAIRASATKTNTKSCGTYTPPIEMSLSIVLFILRNRPNQQIATKIGEKRKRLCARGRSIGSYGNHCRVEPPNKIGDSQRLWLSEVSGKLIQKCCNTRFNLPVTKLLFQSPQLASCISCSYICQCLPQKVARLTIAGQSWNQLYRLRLFGHAFAAQAASFISWS
jgi:hypothetical protein